MPDALSDPSTALYVILATLLLIFLGLWFRRQNRSATIQLGIVLAVFLIVLGIDFSVESPREQTVANLKTIINLASEKNPDQIVPMLASSFNYKGMTKDGFVKASAWETARRYNVRVSTWGFDREDFIPVSENEVTQGFFMKVTAEGKEMPHLFMQGTFVREGDTWKMKTFKVFDNILQKAQGTEYTIPGIP